MSGQVALCIEEAVCCNPEMIGLGGERFDSQTWLEVFSRGDDARHGIAENRGCSEVWVVSCDDVDPINLAATIKSDRPELHVCLVAFDVCGSLLSRAHTARIDEVIEQAAFLRRYADAKAAEVGSDASESVTTQLTAVQDVRALPSQTVVLEAPVDVLEADSCYRKERSLAASLPSANRAFMIAVASGSGGAGKSSVSALGALLACKAGYRTLLLDCDLQFGDAASMIGIEDPLRVDMAIIRPDQLERDLKREEPLHVLAAPARLETAEIVVQGLPALLARLADEFDVILVNTGASWAEQHAIVLERSSAALFLIDQRASSVHACRHALELCSRCGIATGPFQFALNRCAKNAPLSSVDVSCALQGVPVYELKDGGRDVEDYLSVGAAADLIEMRNEFAKSVESVLSQILPGGLPGERRAAERQTGEAGRRSALRHGRHVGRKRGGRRS